MSRSARAANGSSIALPPNPRLTSSTPPAAAARAGQVVDGLAAFEPWLIELPWCSHTGRSTDGTAIGASVRRATRSVISVCGSQTTTSFSWSGRPSNRTVPAGPGSVSATPVVGSSRRTRPPDVPARATSRPSTCRS